MGQTFSLCLLFLTILYPKGCLMQRRAVMDIVLLLLIMDAVCRYFGIRIPENSRIFA
jgi:hypothetical protein